MESPPARGVPAPPAATVYVIDAIGTMKVRAGVAAALRYSHAPMPLFTLADAELAFGDLPLLARADLARERGGRVDLIGRTVSGKSSLLSVIAGALQLDDGAFTKQDGLQI